MKWDKKAFAQAVGLMLMSWAALPIVYWLLVKKHKKEVKKNESILKKKKDN